jgi:hypothetical protein
MKTDLNAFYGRLDELFSGGDSGAIEKYLIKSLMEANENQDYEAYAAIADEMIAFYQMSGQYGKAEEASNDLLLLLEELQMDQTDYFAVVLMNQANSYRDEGKPEQAEEFYLRSENTLHTMRELHAPGATAGLVFSDPAARDTAEMAGAVGFDERMARLTGTLQSNRAILYLKEMRYREAEQEFRSANGCFDSIDAQDDPHYIANMAGIGEALFREGNPADALAAYEAARDVVKAQDGEGKSYALLSQNCAAIADSMHDPVSAQSYRSRAEEIMAKLEAR